MRRKLRTLTTHDELTSAFNRRHLDDSLEREKARADRHGGALCVALMDLDWFKHVNDSYGHLAGDEVLNAFAAIVQGQIRASDLFGRFGGEEFLLILPHTSLADVGPLMERIRSETGTHRWRVGRGDLVVTVSIGIDEYRCGEDAATLLMRIDAALYQAKADGRDRIVYGVAGG
jgi:diguanylate cyclase (GGDEF)-like protein